MKTPSSGLLLARKGDQVTLSCQGEGNPKPTIKWTRVVRKTKKKKKKNPHLVVIKKPADYMGVPLNNII